MRRVLLHSPAFGRDLRKWLKSHPDTAEYDLRVVFEFVEHDGAEAIHLLAFGAHGQVY